VFFSKQLAVAYYLSGKPHPSEDSEALFSCDMVVQQTSLGVMVPGAAEHRWYAAYTTCRHEKRVAEHFQQRAIDHFLPVYKTQRKWRDGSRVTLELPLFPCYIFVRMARPERGLVLSVPGVLTLVGGTGGSPASLADATVDALRQGVREGRVAPHERVTAGQRVRICAGAFAGMTGIVMRKKNAFRVVLELEQIQQSMAVEVDEAELEPMATAERPRLAGLQPA
jgi:transcription antitermination factor NusG